MASHLSKLPINIKLAFITIILCGFVLGASSNNTAVAEAIVGDPVLGADDPILGSKHDFTGLNERAGVAAMTGVAARSIKQISKPCLMVESSLLMCFQLP